ncbi:MAG: hypothetical protein FJX77_09340, partial [Armatimonadetes bacterium]|nr:hypothetical protein [Armatimonadota bacterium]
MTDEELRRVRWRLVLGAGCEGCLGDLEGDWARREGALAYLYDREYHSDRNVRQRGTLDPSQLTVPEWINAVHELFPQRTIERVERDALERYGLDEMVTNPELLQRAQPNPTLLRAVLRTRHLMNQQVLELARRLVRQVVEEMLQRLAREVRAPFTGAVDRRRRSFVRIAQNFDAR